MAGDVTHIVLEPGNVAGEQRCADPTNDLYAELASQAARGDLDAFDELMIQTERRVLSIAWRMLGNSDDARDAVQEVFLRVYRSLKRYRPEDPFMAWVYRITVNVCRDFNRRRRRDERRYTPLDEEDREPLGNDDIEERVLLEQRRQLVMSALAALTERERAAFVLRDLEGLTTAEVASVLGTRAATVRSQVSLARGKIRAFCSRALTGRRRE